jgi:hypothetical protein
MRRRLACFLGGLFLLTTLVAASLGSSSLAAAATIGPTTTCANSVDNTGGLGLICEVKVANTITASGGTAVVTVRECHGAAGDPAAACTTTTQSLTGPVTVVNQCNGSINGGGGTLRCSAQITNTFVGVSPGPTGVTVDQCVGSGGGITTGCNPFPATTSGATITQCNGSANGGTLVGMTCTATGSSAATGGVSVNQCNGSANGGGALVICSANIASSAVAPTPPPTPSPSASPAPTASPSATAAPAASSKATPKPRSTAKASATVTPAATRRPSHAPTAAPLTLPPTDTSPPGATGSSLIGFGGTLVALGALLVLASLVLARRRPVRG